MKQAGLRAVASRPFHLDSSAHSPLHIAMCRDQEVALALMQPAMSRAGIIEEAEYEALRTQIQLDMSNENFTCVSFGVQIWGVAPATQEQEG
jgi:hypothetical protein